MKEAGEARAFHDSTKTLSERYGVDIETCRAAHHWANEWRDLIIDLGTDNVSTTFLLAARDAAAETLDDKLPRDSNEKPTFRSEYIATEMFYESMGQQGDRYRGII